MFTFLAFIAGLLIFSDTNRTENNGQIRIEIFRIDLLTIINAALLAFALTFIAQTAF